MTATWNDLPEPVRVAVQAHTGTVNETADASGGQNADIATVLWTEYGRSLFLKGVNGVSRRMRWLRNEVTVGKLGVEVAPAVLFALDVEDWLVVGFEYVPGRAANLAPGSPDLPLVARAVEQIGAVRPTELRALRDRWSETGWWNKLAEEVPTMVHGWDVEELNRWECVFPELVDGDRLAHTDLHGEQFRIGDDGSVHVIDWGYPGIGAPWVDAAFLVIRFVEAGHAPADAERWVRANIADLLYADDECLTAFAVYVAGLWGYWAATGDISGAKGRAQIAREYAAWRLAA